MKISKITSALLFTGLASASLINTVQAQDLDITVTNLTQGLYYTPILITAHDASTSLYSVGEMASPELQMMAEGGALTGLLEILESTSADVVDNPAAGLLAPGMSTSVSFSTDDSNMYLSVTAMLLPTNDGFLGVDSWPIPTEPGTYTIEVNGYDAGTEANDEIVNGGGAPGVAGIPGAPGGSGTGGTGVTTEESNTYIHVHRGSLGDDDATGGKSDLDNTVHRWLNPVALVTVTVN